VSVLNQLEPQNVFYYFEAISDIPRGSGNEKEISDYICNFAKGLGLFYRQDEAYNVLIKKKGTAGYEDSQPLIIQGHIDMVCEKNGDILHDFVKDKLGLRIVGDDIYATGTTLGADNGIAVAYMMAILASNDIAHPPIEAVFTTDEEVGMKGAKAFDCFDLEGRLFLNMDSEEEGKLLVSCCGGKRATMTLPIEREKTPAWGEGYTISIKGLKGGHSGSDIHLQRGNANKLMGRVLSALIEKVDMRMANIEGGFMDNAISREAEVVLYFHEEDVELVKNEVLTLEKTFRHEYRTSDKGVSLIMKKQGSTFETVFTTETIQKVTDILILMPYGVETMSLDMKGLVESSNNIGIVKVEDDRISFHCAIRSSVGSRKKAIYEKVQAVGRLVGAEVTYSSEYPAWEYNPNSYLVELFRKIYEETTGKVPEIEAIHAGLECGLFGEKIPGLDMISIGPNMYDVHTPDERISISSTARVWSFLKAVLKALQ